MVISVIVAIGSRVAKYNKDSTSKTTKQNVGNNQTNNNSKPSTLNQFDKKKYSIDEPGSIWWIVNKKRPLPAGYIPNDLVVPSVTLRLSSGSEQMKLSSKLANDVVDLFNAAKTAGYPLVLASGYRSYAYQVQLYNGYVQKDGQAAADRYSAKPGTSEHQTGLAFDVCAINASCDLQQSFGQTPTGKWLAGYAYQYGFIIRYIDGKESVTGYKYEPWHLRYVGKELAGQLHTSGQTMEEFFGL